MGDCKYGCGQLLGAGLIGGLKDKADWGQKSGANQCRGWSPGLEPQQDWGMGDPGKLKKVIRAGPGWEPGWGLGCPLTTQL